MSDDKAQYADFYHNLITNILEKALQGKYNYDRDMQQLDKYLEAARKMGVEDQIKGVIINTRGALSGISGRYDNAQQYFMQSYEYQMERRNHNAAMTSLLNYALSKKTQGDYAASEAAFKQAESFVLENDMHVSLQFITGLADLYYAMGRYDDVRDLCEQFEQEREYYFERDHLVYAQAVTEVSNLRARVDLRDGRVEQAYRDLSGAMETVLPNVAKMTLASLHMTRAYIVHALGASGEIDIAINAAEKHLNDAHAPVQIARFYIEEAEDAAYFGLEEIARQFAEHALAEFEARDMHYDIERSRQILERIQI